MKLTIKVDGDVYEVEVEVAEEESPHPSFVPASGGYVAPIAGPGPPPSASQQTVEDESKVCRSPVSGVVIRIPVAPGEDIEADQELMVLEAMKMETVITAPVSGKLLAVNAEVGGSVKSGDVLIEFE